MAEHHSVTGMVISDMPIGDYDKRLLILTKELGKISAFARGARKPNSPLIAGTRPFSFGQFSIYQGKGSYNVNSIEISNYFTELSQDFEGAYYGFYFLELADYFGRENVDGEESLKLLYQSFRALINKNVDNRLVRSVYELKLFQINGEYPSVSECLECGTKDELSVFSHSHEGVFCSGCRSKAKDGKILNTSTFYAMQFVLSSPIEKLFTFKVSDVVLKELTEIMKNYLKNHLDKKLKSLEILENIIV